MATRYAPIGGQAVIEGVMMRSPSMISTAVRRPDGSIAVRTEPFESLSSRQRLFALPIVRGAVALIESMRQGLAALAFSADQAAGIDEDGGAERRASFAQRLAIPLSIALSFGIGLLLFFWVPLVLADLTGARSGFVFNLIDGAFRLAVFLTYITLISLWSEMRSVFQYHGAEHKSIAAFEAGDELVPERVALYSRFHPRCGTSFLLLVMMGSIFVFMLLGRPDSIAERLERFLLIPLVGGVAFELTRLSGQWADHPIVRLLILPGLLLQRVTTREPTRDQIEVAIRSVREVTRESGGQLIPI